MTFRLVLYFVILTVTILYIMRYAEKVRQDPTKSILYDPNQSDDADYMKHSEEIELQHVIN